ncbi:MAG: helix-turn-helix domain-containing protein, partial [Nannocystaceae bacterium]|nr:helix-turn-helix domain-containing protein [Nannocystaceae bacterium]
SLELLESDHHDSLPGPVFVKGFLRCCARALGLEAEVVMELVYERERELLQARRRERPAAAPTSAEAPMPGAAPTPPATLDAAPPVQGQGPGAAAAAAQAEGMSLVGGLRHLVRRGGVSMMLWVAVALFVAMVMMAAFNMLGVSTVGPT